MAFGLAGFVQSITGFGSALVAIPILAIVMGPAHAVVAMTVVSLVLSGWSAVRERAHVDLPVASRLVVAGMLGLPLGLLLLRYAGDGVLQVLMAVTVLGALALVLSRVRLPPGRVAGAGAGVLSGALLTSTGMNGPPLVLGVLAGRPEPRAFRGTLQAVLAVQDLVAVVGFVVIGLDVGSLLAYIAVGVLASRGGWWAGDRVFARIPAKRFDRVVALALAASAVMLLLSGIA
ncbi:MAG TPA: sulfite exporter TauE/SafE family protein [Marmoricola sp.]|nr:sulfite exporter TauE/SafE family protein [Marmoricola sp.]